MEQFATPLKSIGKPDNSPSKQMKKLLLLLIGTGCFALIFSIGVFVAILVIEAKLQPQKLPRITKELVFLSKTLSGLVFALGLVFLSYGQILHRVMKAENIATKGATDGPVR